MEYVEFTNYNNKGLETQFVKELNDSGVEHLITLSKIISFKKNNIKVNLSRCKYDDVYTVMICCHQDFILINLGRKYNFPRGFPILWIPGKMIKLFGFYPKFDNDDRQSPDTQSDFDDVNNIQFFKKWSGFLGQVCIFKLGAKICWSCCSKNSADYGSEFVQGCRRLFEQVLNPTNINALLSQNYHLCAEMMTFNDQGHGARVLKESPVITSIGKGCLVYLDGSSANVITGNMVDFVPHQPLVEFCRQHSLPCDSAIIITNENASAFMKELSGERDFMTNDRLNALIAKNSEKVTIIKGTVRHKDILGNVLEGLVVKAIKANGEILTKKYKFPYYTVRTMALRELIKNAGPLNLINPRTNTDGFKNYCERWCITDLGKEFWYKFLCTCALILKKQEHPKFEPSYVIGLHIQISDFVLEDILINKLPPSLDITVFDEFMARYEDEMANSIKSTVIISVGPIGSGKSSTSEKIAKNSDGLCVHIDGDKLDLGTLSEVMGLKGERNDYTIWQVIRVLMQGRIPIISTGGGALYSFGRKQQFLLKQRIMEILGIDVKIILLIPTSDIVQFEDYDKGTHNVEDIYQKNDEDIMAVVIGRVQRGEWNVPDEYFPSQKKSQKSLEVMKSEQEFVRTAAQNFSRKIVGVSRKNLVFANDLKEIADDVIMYPRYHSENYSQLKSLFLNYDLILGRIVGPKDLPEFGNFQQHRILVKKPDETYHHITMGFDGDRQIKLPIAQFEKINTRLSSQDTYVGIHVGLQGNLENGKPTKPCEFIIVPEIDVIVTDKGAHVTIDAGDHANSMMRSLTLAIRSSKDFVDIENKKGENVIYDLSTREENQVVLKLVSNFGI